MLVLCVWVIVTQLFRLYSLRVETVRNGSFLRVTFSLGWHWVHRHLNLGLHHFHFPLRQLLRHYLQLRILRSQRTRIWTFSSLRWASSTERRVSLVSKQKKMQGILNEPETSGQQICA